MKIELKNTPHSRFQMEEREYLYFGGTSYLGLQTHEGFQNLLIGNIRQLGTNWGASRISNVKLSIFNEFELYISKISGVGDTICVSSGFLAGQILAGYFSQKEYKLFGAPNSHPAIIHKQSCLFPTYHDLEIAINKNAREQGEQIVLFLDSIDFAGGNYPHFSKLSNLNLKNIILVVDDSHGLGLIGENGFGLRKILEKIDCKELILCGSLGKACATPCGLIMGATKRLRELRKTEYYAGGSPPSPAALKTFIEGETYRIQLLKKLRANIQLFKQLINPEFPQNPLENHPVFGYNSSELTESLGRDHIITTNFPYPSENSKLVSKIVLSAAHSVDDISKLCQSINAFYHKSA